MPLSCQSSEANGALLTRTQFLEAIYHSRYNAVQKNGKEISPKRYDADTLENVRHEFPRNPPRILLPLPPEPPLHHLVLDARAPKEPYRTTEGRHRPRMHEPGRVRIHEPALAQGPAGRVPHDEARAHEQPAGDVRRVPHVRVRPARDEPVVVLECHVEREERTQRAVAPHPDRGPREPRVQFSEA